jgi:hypothetical protein
MRISPRLFSSCFQTRNQCRAADCRQAPMQHSSQGGRLLAFRSFLKSRFTKTRQAAPRQRLPRESTSLKPVSKLFYFLSSDFSRSLKSPQRSLLVGTRSDRKEISLSIRLSEDSVALKADPKLSISDTGTPILLSKPEWKRAISQTPSARASMPEIRPELPRSHLNCRLFGEEPLPRLAWLDKPILPSKPARKRAISHTAPAKAYARPDVPLSVQDKTMDILTDEKSVNTSIHNARDLNLLSSRTSATASKHSAIAPLGKAIVNGKLDELMELLAGLSQSELDRLVNTPLDGFQCKVADLVIERPSPLELAVYVMGSNRGRNGIEIARALAKAGGQVHHAASWGLLISRTRNMFMTADQNTEPSSRPKQPRVDRSDIDNMLDIEKFLLRFSAICIFTPAQQRLQAASSSINLDFDFNEIKTEIEDSNELIASAEKMRARSTNIEKDKKAELPKTPLDERRIKDELSVIYVTLAHLAAALERNTSDITRRLPQARDGETSLNLTMSRASIREVRAEIVAAMKNIFDKLTADRSHFQEHDNFHCA